MRLPITLAIAGIIAILVAYFSLSPKVIATADKLADSPAPTDSVQKTKAPTPFGQAKVESVKPAAPAPKKSKAEQRAVDLESLHQMTQSLYSYTQGNRDIKDLLEDLKTSGQKPIAARQTNPYTGERITIRTKSPLRGTSYFEATYVSDGGANDERHLQMMTFDFRKGPKSMADAFNAVELAFPTLEMPKDKNVEFYSWPLPDGYVLQINRLSAVEIDQGSRYTPYNLDDVGVIQLTVMEEIHAEEDLDHQ